MLMSSDNGGIPLTNGEVFAILRRNRDMRYAKALPGFGMQSRNLPPNAASQLQQQRQRARNDKLGAARDASQRALQDFNAQNAVALYEVRGLYGLKPEGQSYGVTSVYAASFQPTVVPPKHQGAANAPPPEDGGVEDIATGTSHYFAISGFGTVGTRAHVTAVQRELDALDSLGRKNEIEMASRLKRTAQQFGVRLAEHEIRNLISIKPTSEVVVAATLPGLDTRAESEDAASTFANAIVQVFLVQPGTGGVYM